MAIFTMETIRNVSAAFINPYSATYVAMHEPFRTR